MAQLSLPNGAVAFLDDEDMPLVEGRSWYLHKSSGREYVASKTSVGGKRQVTFLHRLLADGERERVGFRNGNTLDCRRDNLRVVGHSAPEKTYERGSLGEALVIADLARHGHDVFVPIAGHTAADLISVRGSGKPIRWQVKFRKASKGSLVVSLSAVHPLKGGYLRKPYNLDAIDGFAICCPDPEAIYYVPTSHLDRERGSFSICLGPYAGRGGGKDGLKYMNPDIADTMTGTLTC